MQFSKEDQEMIKLIAKGEVTDLPSFVTKACNLVQEDVRHYQEANGVQVDLGIPEKKWIVDDDAAFRDRVLGIIWLCERLERQGMVQLPNQVFIPAAPPMMALRPAPGQIVFVEPGLTTQCLRENNYFKVVRFPDLQTFIDNGFFTPDELDRKEERSARDKAQKDTRFLSYWSIGVSIIVTISTAVFNYATYTNDRKVTLQNVNDREHPVVVEMLNLPVPVAPAAPLKDTATTPKPAQAKAR